MLVMDSFGVQTKDRIRLKRRRVKASIRLRSVRLRLKESHHKNKSIEGCGLHHDLEVIASQVCMDNHHIQHFPSRCKNNHEHGQLQHRRPIVLLCVRQQRHKTSNQRHTKDLQISVNNKLRNSRLASTVLVPNWVIDQETTANRT